MDIIIITFIFGIDGVVTRIIETSYEDEFRFTVFYFGIEQFLNFPFFGYGLGNFETLFRLEIQNNQFFYDHTHNDFIEFIGEAGLIGMFILLVILTRIIISLKNNKILPEIKFLILAILIIVIIHGNLDFSLHMPQIIYILVFIFSLSQCNIKS